MGELTLQWINEHTVPCGGCGSRIEKAGGCDLIECLCGYRFCYGCGVAGGECGCHPGHVFHNDVYLLNDSYVPDAPVRDGSGRVDVRSCIWRRAIRQERELERDRRIGEESEYWEYSEANVGVCTSNGRWLFVPTKDAGSIMMLTQQLHYESIRDECEFQRGSTWYHQHLRWYSLGGSFSYYWLYLPLGGDIEALKLGPRAIEARALARRALETIIEARAAPGRSRCREKRRRKLVRSIREIYDAVRKRWNKTLESESESEASRVIAMDTLPAPLEQWVE